MPRVSRQRVDSTNTLLGMILCGLFWAAGFAQGQAMRPAYAAAPAPVAVTVMTFTPQPTATATPTLEPTATPTEVPIPAKPPDAARVVSSRWQRAGEVYAALRQSLPPEAIAYGIIRDEALIAMLVYSEFGIYADRAVFSEAMGALHNQYWSETFCRGACVGITEQLLWLATMQGFYAGEPSELAEQYRIYLPAAYEIQATDGLYSGRRGWVWGNFDYWGPQTSAMGDFVLRDGSASWWYGDGLPYLAMDAKWSPPFVVLTLAQAQACWKIDCMGLKKP